MNNFGIVMLKSFSYAEIQLDRSATFDINTFYSSSVYFQLNMFMYSTHHPHYCFHTSRSLGN